jgi:hypothetical protein
MPLDHYVSQVHLRKFCSPALGNRLYAIRKSDLKAFTPRPEDICRIADGSTNSYLTEAREIEEFLKTIEPNYNAAVEKLVTGAIDRESIYAIAGFVAYVLACSPGGMRIQSGPLRGAVENTAAMLDARGQLPPAPTALGGARLTALLRAGTVEVTIDPKYPQVIGIQDILRMTALFGNFPWEILHNGDSAESPFLTSDFPIAIETTDDPRILNRLVPLAPDLALRIKPDVSLDRARADLAFTNFRHRSRKLAGDEVAKLNRVIVQCAEDTVAYRDGHPWVRTLVAKNRHYRIEPKNRRLQTATGTLLVSTARIVDRSTRSDRAR